MKIKTEGEDVEKMILGNKCDMDDKRQVPKDTGENVSLVNMLQLNIENKYSEFVIQGNNSPI